MLDNNDKDFNSFHTPAQQNQVSNSNPQQIIIICHHPERHLQEGETHSNDQPDSKPNKKGAFGLGIIFGKLLDFIENLVKKNR